MNENTKTAEPSAVKKVRAFVVTGGIRQASFHQRMEGGEVKGVSDIAPRAQVGPYPAGHVFDENAFKALHPLPEGKLPDYIDREAYHGQLIDRLLAMNVIRLRKTQADTAGPADLEPMPNPTDGVWGKGLGQSPIAFIPPTDAAPAGIHRPLTVG